MAEDFDPDEYRRRYPDVAMSGLKPNEHFHLFGKLLNRKAPRRIPAKPVEVKPEAAQPPPPPPAETPKSAAPTSTVPPSTPPKAAAKKKAAIVERPADFSPEDSIVHPAPPRRGIDGKGFVDLDSLIGKAPAQAQRALQSLR